MSSPKQEKPDLRVVADTDAVARECLDIFVATAEQVIKTNNVFHLAISGGHTPKSFFELLAADQKSLSLPWDKIHLFWVDERYVPHDSVHSNYKLAADTFLTKIPIPKQNIHPIPIENEDACSAAKQYEKTIRSTFNIKSGQLPKFDLIILGMGTDGHTGSLFPNSFASFDTKDIACVVYLLDQKMPDQTITRITLTHPVLCAARQLTVLVAGPEKAEILKKVFTSPPEDICYPIHALWPAIDRITWLVDSAAAKLL
ncbi:MAG: 6-phosphogluconolactonase [Planctomycetota bacterium]